MRVGLLNIFRFSIQLWMVSVVLRIEVDVLLNILTFEQSYVILLRNQENTISGIVNFLKFFFVRNEGSEVITPLFAVFE
jgi:hypothetical protein